MSEPFLGNIIMFGGNFAIRGFAQCDGQLLAINSNQALFSLLGTIYGGDGRTTFALPDMRGRIPLHQGQGPGLSNRTIGSRSGSETNTLSTNQMPAHTHAVNAPVSTEFGTVSSPQNSYPAVVRVGNGRRARSGKAYQTTSNATLGAMQVSNTGSAESFNNVQPFQSVNFLIALTGLFPSRS